MAGVKGRSGGKRAGSGAKKKPRPPASMEDVLLPSADRAALGVPPPPAPFPPPGAGDTDQPVVQLPEDAQQEPVPACATPLELLERIMNDTRLDLKVRLKAAVAAAQYRHPKRSEEGSKKTKVRTAEDVAKGDRLRPQEPPKLRAIQGRKDGT